MDDAMATLEDQMHKALEDEMVRRLDDGAAVAIETPRGWLVSHPPPRPIYNEHPFPDRA